MHAAMRRVPVERARHAKRLGHVALANPIVTTTQPTATSPTPSSQTPSSATPSSSSALSASSVAQSSSASTTSSGPTPSSTASSSVTQSPTPTEPSSSSTLARPTISASTYPTSSSTSAATDTNAVSHSGLSGGAIAGIIAGAVIVGVAFIVFLVRKTYLRRRQRQRISWNGAPGLGAGISDEPKFPDISERLASDLNLSQAGPPLSPFEARGQSMYSTPVPPVVHMQPPTMPPYAVPALPPVTYNNPAAYPTHPVSYNRAGNTTPFAPGRVAPSVTSTLPPVRGQHAPLEAIVKCTFVPSLPDELSITTGERVFILEQYDDGWALCANGRGERGMAPRDCLDHAPIDQSGIGWGNVARTSSLNPDGTRY